MRLIASVLPWVVLGVLLVEFSLSGDLPAPSVRRVFVGLGSALVMLAAVAAWLAPDVADSSLVVASGGPLLFLVAHALLRRGFRSLKGNEPTFVSTGTVRGGGSSRFFFEPEVRREVTRLDYVYSFLLGVAMLLAGAGAIAVVVERAS